MSGPRWAATGWRDNRVIQFTLFLPAGVSARVLKDVSGGKWRYFVGRSACELRDMSEQFSTKTAAMRACERQIMSELRNALRILGATT